MSPWEFLKKGKNYERKKGISILWDGIMGRTGAKHISPISGPVARGANEFCSVWLGDEFALTVLTAKYEKMSKNRRILLNCPKERKKLMSFPCHKMYFWSELKSFPGSQMPCRLAAQIYFINLENISKNNIFDRQPGVKAKINVLWSCYLVTPRRQVTNNEMLL